MSLADRVARLEAKFSRALPMPVPKVVPVISITLHDDDLEDTPYLIQHAGCQWEQRAGETVPQLHARARAEALNSVNPDQTPPVVILVAKAAAGEPDLRGKTRVLHSQTVTAGVGVSDLKD